MRFVCLFLFLISIPLHASQQEAFPYVVINAKTGRILAQRSAHLKCYPASTTKIATLAYIVSTQGLDIHQKIIVPHEAIKALPDVEKSRDNFALYPSYVLEARGSSAGLKAGEVITVEEAIYGAMLPSGNDAANVLAYYWGNRSIPHCVENINHFVESLGCNDTHFENPHGLHHPCHVSTAYDLALIAAVGLQNPLFATVVKTMSYTKPASNKQAAIIWHQSNRLLLPGPLYCKQASGVKTGYHSRAGNCFVGSGSNTERTIIVSLLHCPDRKLMFTSAKKILERFLQEAKVKKKIVDEGRLGLTRHYEGQVTPVALKALKPAVLEYFPSEEPLIKVSVEWLKEAFPIKKGQKLGTLRIYADNVEVEQVDVVADEDRQATWTQKISFFKERLHKHKLVALLVLITLIMGIFALVSRSSKRR
jgi:serine-type D-Ala-D-Ala carboxypeptidase (penicillin-binding protein 5/6)